MCTCHRWLRLVVCRACGSACLCIGTWSVNDLDNKLWWIAKFISISGKTTWRQPLHDFWNSIREFWILIQEFWSSLFDFWSPSVSNQDSIPEFWDCISLYDLLNSIREFWYLFVNGQGKILPTPCRRRPRSLTRGRSLSARAPLDPPMGPTLYITYFSRQCDYMSWTHQKWLGHVPRTFGGPGS